MLSLQQAYEVRASILEYLKATFTFKEKAVGDAFLRFVEDEQQGMFKGPYLSLKLPFESGAAGTDIPLTIQPPFPPFAHQLAAFQRLHTQDDHQPEATILTTGTGSGKTESFLYPLLDYCHQQQGRPGIKCIILYPMNALATDQAARLAKAIHEDTRLRGKVTAGLFIGLGRDGRKYPKDMTEEHIIENRESITDSPPDILLTNFKMLDYALMRHKYHSIWQHNLADPTLLRFLVLDELHTYDGAQGTDVANLIRRLKLKLGLEPGQLCPIGTSATIGSGADAPRLLAGYASRIFGEEIAEDAVITETRLDTVSFFGNNKQDLYNRLPSTYKLQSSTLITGEDYQSYLKRQLDLWQIDPEIDPVGLGRELKKIRLVWDIVDQCSQQLLTVNELIRKLNYVNDEFRKIPERDAQRDFWPKESVIRSILSLIAEAKTPVGTPESRTELPMLYLQTQLWIRELSGVLRQLSSSPTFVWRDQLASPENIKALPAYFCRECGASGWLGVKHDNRNKFEDDINDVYQKYFTNHKNIFLINTSELGHKPVDEYQPTESHDCFLGERSLELHDREGPGRLPILAYRVVRNNRNWHFCPECNSRNSLSIIGTRTTTLASVTTSQILASDLDEQTERNRKLLAFSNGVQDAAHQAGFFEARNYRFTFRTALQQVINQFDEPLPLDQLQTAFVQYWKERADDSGKGDLAAYLYKFFPSDRAGEVKIQAYRGEDGSYSVAFLQEFDERIRWEIASEFGFNAIIGRTLEKTGSSAVAFDPERIAKVYPALKLWMDDNLMGQFEVDAFQQFLHGFLHRIRMRGGIDHPYLEKYRERDLKLWDLNWQNDRRHFLNRRFGPRSRFPRLITGQVDTRGIIDSTNSQLDNWYNVYLRKSYQLTPASVVINEFYAALLKTLANDDIGLLDHKQSKNLANYSLRPEAILVSNQVVSVACDTCNHTLNVAPTDAERLQDARCLQYKCLGAYQATAVPTTDSYYRQVYNRRRAPRIYATDHTGLLERRDRENKERDFKERPRFNSLNTLVATSTLEMGIDIGDLNVTMNTDIPPLPANFMQRIGRAGRKSGSALIINFAANKPHDLFYFEEPLDMMNGEINTPGCYLDAREILKRHFFAFCIDSWTSEDPENHTIPPLIRLLRLASTNIDDPLFFVNRLIRFIKLKEQNLLFRFRSMYSGQVEEKTFLSLQADLHSEQFYKQITNVFRQLQAEHRLLREKRQAIKKTIKEKQLGKEDDERMELDREARNIFGTLKSIEKRQVLEHLTNTGLLPNYAFPETGVTLNARVKGKRTGDNDFPPLTKDIEVIRPAQTAIKELIPDNQFYTQGYKLNISGLQVLNWKEEADLFRYCSNCDHLLPDILTEKTPCPKCGHESWASAANTHHLLRLRAVKSFNDEASATLDDSSEERQSEFTLHTRHFRFHPEASLGAYAMKQIPFGIEYVRNVDILEVNTGISMDFRDRNRITEINGLEAAISGYITCRYCGKSSSFTHKEKNGRWEAKEARDYHYAYCKDRGTAYSGKSDEVFEEVFLYRQMQTEALKILLPVQEFESDSAISMFKAGIELGLRKYYQGNPQHIRIREYAEYNFQTQKTDLYLVLFDIIPGGTGYLEKLFAPEAFSQVIRLAYENIRDCGCQHQGKDGCYRCIYSYTNQFDQAHLSRQRAEKLFKRIIDAQATWENIPQGLGKVTNTGQIEESELEDRFIRLLRVYANHPDQQEKGWSFREVNRDGIICYQLKVVENGNEFFYFIEPQYRMGPAKGVQYSTIADFLIRCEGANVQGRELSYDDLQQFRSIAIYLDGYQYHASREHSKRFYFDLERRQAIAKAPDLMSWTLTWEDIRLFEEGLPDSLGQIARENAKTRDNLFRVLSKQPYRPNKQVIGAAGNNLSRLCWLLGQGVNTIAYWSSFQFYLGCQQAKLGAHAIREDNVKDFLQSERAIKTYPLEKSGDGFFEIPIVSSDQNFKFRILARLKDLDLRGRILISRQLNEDFNKDDWELFWRVFNLLQFELTEVEIEIKDHTNVPVPVAKETPTEDSEEVLTYYDEEYHDLIRQLLEQDIEFSRDGSFVLMDEEIKNKVVAEAVLGFPAEKIVLGPLSEEDRQAFEKKGFQIYTVENFNLNLLSTYEADHI